MPDSDASSARAAATLRYLGHAAFMVTTAGEMRVLMDPFQNPRGQPRWFKRRFPPLRANVVTVSHDHFDHNALRAIGGIPAVIRSAGTVRLMDLSVRAIPDLHAGNGGTAAPMPNHIVMVESGGVRLCHVGDNRHAPAAEALDAIRPADVLMVPVDDSSHLLSFDEVGALIEAIEPRVVVPMHYFSEGLTAPESTLLGIDRWLDSLAADRAVRRLGTSDVSISPTMLPDASEREVWVLDAALA